MGGAVFGAERLVGFHEASGVCAFEAAEVLVELARDGLEVLLGFGEELARHGWCGSLEFGFELFAAIFEEFFRLVGFVELAADFEDDGVRLSVNEFGFGVDELFIEHVDLLIFLAELRLDGGELGGGDGVLLRLHFEFGELARNELVLAVEVFVGALFGSDLAIFALRRFEEIFRDLGDGLGVARNAFGDGIECFRLGRRAEDGLTCGGALAIGLAEEGDIFALLIELGGIGRLGEFLFEDEVADGGACEGGTEQEGNGEEA